MRTAIGFNLDLQPCWQRKIKKSRASILLGAFLVAAPSSALSTVGATSGDLNVHLPFFCKKTFSIKLGNVGGFMLFICIKKTFPWTLEGGFTSQTECFDWLFPLHRILARSQSQIDGSSKKFPRPYLYGTWKSEMMCSLLWGVSSSAWRVKLLHITFTEVSEQQDWDNA